MVNTAPSMPRHARLAQRLVDAAVEEQWPAGFHVTEDHAARLLAVSRTPARAALLLLAAQGVVGRLAGQGYRLRRAGRELAGVVLAVPPAQDAALRTALIQDRLAGRIGVEPSQAELVRRYQVGLPTLQRVLSGMQQEGLVSHEAWHWSFAPTLETLQSRAASYALRLLLEPAALLLPGVQVDAALLRGLIAEHDAFLAQGDWDASRIFDLDARFHESLAGFSGNPFIRTIIRQQNALRRFLEVGSYGDAALVRLWCREHRAIMQALIAGRMELASRKLRAHLTRAAEAAKRLDAA